MPFDPARPDPGWSLNRVRLIDLPGVRLPDAVRGRSAYELVSTAALDQLLQQQDFLPQMAFTERREAFFMRLADGDSAAEYIAHLIGQRLTWLLLALKRGDAVNRAARPEWDAAIWEYWSQIRQVHLGGGLVQGQMGACMLQAALPLLADHLVLDIAPHPAYLPLLGAARTAHNSESVPVFDFGGTRIKRALARYHGGQIIALELRPPLPAAWHSPDDPQAVFEQMLGIIAADCTISTAETIPVSIASYVDANGQPLPAQSGIYMRLGQLYGNLSQAFSEALTTRSGQVRRVHLLHDGSAAALVYAPQNNSAVIMIGTALGIGFPTQREDLCSLAANVSISGEHAG